MVQVNSAVIEKTPDTIKSDKFQGSHLSKSGNQEFSSKLDKIRQFYERAQGSWISLKTFHNLGEDRYTQTVETTISYEIVNSLHTEASAKFVLSLDLEGSFIVVRVDWTKKLLAKYDVVQSGSYYQVIDENKIYRNRVFNSIRYVSSDYKFDKHILIISSNTEDGSYKERITPVVNKYGLFNFYDIINYDKDHKPVKVGQYFEEKIRA